MAMAMITPEYVAEYINNNDKNIEKLLDTIDALKERLTILENNKLIMTERNEHLVFRLSAAEQRVSELNNTMMNHFAYNKPVVPPSPTPPPSIFKDIRELKPFSPATPPPSPFSFETPVTPQPFKFDIGPFAPPKST